ncbi:MAG: hypothetical protein QOH62_2481, partial [Solirubrobacteraceae bacterium]|nr:hypothetical protein [Solirubrobacteraceae bacterium]
AEGRLRFVVDLGTVHTAQQYTEGASTTFERRRVSLAPHAVLRITKVVRVKRGVRVCARVIGGEVPRARITAAGRSVGAMIGAKTSCHVVRVRHSPATVAVRGRDRFGHPVRATAPARSRR